MNEIPDPTNFAEGILDAASSETLSGDIRDALLTQVRSIKVPWAMLTEDEQQNAIDAISKTAESAVRSTARIIAQRGFETVIVTTGKWTVKEGVKLECEASATLENINSLAQHGSSAAVLVLVDPKEYLGERAPAKPDKDQPDLIDDKQQ